MAAFSTGASNAMTLKRFMLRQEVLKLYRDTMRTIRAVDDERQRKELRAWARHDFDINKHVEDEYAPYHVIDAPGFNADIRGVCGEILKAIAASLRTNYTVSFPHDSYWGLLKPDGNWTGVVGMLQRDEADLAMSVINPTSEKKDVAVETETILPIELMVLAGRLSRHQSNIFGIIQVLTWEVWLLFACSLVLSALLWTSSDWAHFHAGGGSLQRSHRFPFLRTFRNHFWCFVENCCLEASTTTPSRTSARIVVGSFWLLVIVVTTVVAGQMKAMMMVREEADRIDSMRHLAERPHMKPYTVAGSAGVSSVRDSKDPYYQRVWRMMQKYKTDLPTSVVLSDRTMREVVTSRAVLILSRASLATRAMAACATFDRGEFYVAREPMFKFNSVFYLNKRLSAARRQAINNRILWLRDSGLVAKWWQESSGNWEGCGQAVSDGRLTFSDFQDLLLFWLAMLSVATAWFLGELAANLLCSRGGLNRSR
ncbi:putative glutamate receptor [Haemaphysalis longicornis]